MCKHPKLVKIENIENGGEDSTIYRCEVCEARLRVEISDETITVQHGLPKS